MGNAEQAPFMPDVVEATQQELSEAARVLDLAEHRLDDLLAQSIPTTAAGALELARHRRDQAAQPPLALIDRGGAAMLLPAGGDVGGDAALGEAGNVGFGTVAGIGGSFVGTLAGGGFDGVDHGN